MDDLNTDTNPGKKSKSWIFRWFLAIVCLALASSRIIWPHLAVDEITIWLVALAAMILLIPQIAEALGSIPRSIPGIKRLKAGPFELEFQESLKELTGQVLKASESAAQAGASGPTEKTGSDLEEVFQEASRDPRAALLLVAVKIEQAVRGRFRKAGYQEEGDRVSSVPHLAKRGKALGILDEDSERSLLRFWQLRNTLVHKGVGAVSDGTVWSMLGVGTEILRLLSSDLPPDLLVFCEGPTDRDVVSSLVQFVTAESVRPTRVRYSFVVGGGFAGVRDSLRRYVKGNLVSLEVGQVGQTGTVVLVDSDGEDPEFRRNVIKQDLAPIEEAHTIAVAVAVPNIEAWIGLRRKVPRTEFLDRLASVDWKQAAADNSEIGRLVDFLQKNLV